MSVIPIRTNSLNIYYPVLFSGLYIISIFSLTKFMHLSHSGINGAMEEMLAHKPSRGSAGRNHAAGLIS
jgi:hypothetical protein